MVRTLNREAMTVRIPADLLAEVRRLKSERESLNSVVIDALTHELRRRRGLKAVDEIERLAEEGRKRHGVLPSSVDLIREMREERVARLMGDLPGRVGPDQDTDH